MGVPVTVAMGNSYYVFFCAHGNSHGHAHAYNHGHAHDYVHGHVYYWQTCFQVSPGVSLWSEYAPGTALEVGNFFFGGSPPKKFTATFCDLFR